MLAVIVATACLTGCGVQMGRGIDSIAQSRPVQGLAVSVEPSGNVFWTVAVQNNSGSAAQLVWDESVYVNTDGQATRLIRGNTRKLFSGQSQPNTPIPSGAAITEMCVPEAHVELAGSVWTPKAGNPVNDARIVLTFRIGARTETWEATVSYQQPDE